jgi:diguanylate cyclase (GGDEF)-like protein/PAS domain S-box-containing protein
MITAATPVYSPDGERFLGVAGVNSQVQDAVRGLFARNPLGDESHPHADEPVQTTSLVVDETTRPVLIGEDCRTLLGLEANAGPTRGGRIESAPLIESGPAALRAVLEHATAEPGTHLEGLMLDDRRYIAAVQPMPTTGWTLINLVAEATLVERVESARDAFDRQITTKTLAVSLVAGGLILLIAIGLTLYLRRMVATPLEELATAADAIAAGQPRVMVPVRSDDEIGRVGRRFNALSERLTETLEALESQVDERTRDAEAVRDYFYSIFEHSPAGILFIDGTRHIERANPAFAALVGHDVEAIIGRSPIEFYRDPEEARIIGREAYPVLESGGTFRSVVTLERADGSPIICSVMGRAVNPGVLDEGFIWVIQDITEQKRLERELAHLATHDHLTGSYNRLKIVEVMEQTTRAATRYGHTFSVVLFDVDHFKLINDTHGHTAGDRVLRQLTAAVEASLRETDFLGRWGGEEFIVLAPHTPLGAAAQLAERIRLAIADTTFPDVDTVTVSLGVVAYCPGETLEQLEERADHFLYRAKQSGRNRVVTQDDVG